MIVLVGGLILLVVSPLLGLSLFDVNPEAQLPESFKDVFLPGQNGKPTLGSMGATCWARGGICVNIRQCPSLQMETSIAGCNWGYKVCCKIHEPTSPTVGNLRRQDIPLIATLEELGNTLELVALGNSMLMNKWQGAKPESEEISLYDLLNQ